MTTQELKQRFDELYESMAESKNVQNMHIFGDAFTRLFGKVAESHPDLAMATINLLSAVEYHNFVTAEEASVTAAKFINDDDLLMPDGKHTLGPHWRIEDLKSFLAARQLPVSEKPYYNWPALWLTVNMIYSDFADALAKLLATKDAERIANACYELAVKKLKDKDRLNFIRGYFSL